MILSDVKGLSRGSERRVLLKCDTCSAVTTTTYHNYCLSQEKKGWTGITKCRSCATKISGLNRRGNPAWNKGQKLSQDKRGPGHPSWKGGTYISSDGYRMVYVGTSQDNESGWSNYRKEHVLVAERVLGRALNDDDVVHHKDGNKLNNDPENLWVCTSSEHRKAHASLQKIAFELYISGYITFDDVNKEYVAHIKRGELLEQPAEANQQPSNGGDVVEGSETRSRVSMRQ